MKQNEQWENFIKFVEAHQNAMSELIYELGRLWVGEGEAENLGNYDMSVKRKRYTVSFSESKAHYRLILWYGSAEYTPPKDMDFDMDDNAWFVKKSVHGFYSIISLHIQHKQILKFSASFSDLLSTLETNKYISKEFSSIQDMKFWLLNFVVQSIHNFDENNKT